MTEIAVITRDANAAETLTDADYREIYDELRQTVSLRDFTFQVINSGRSFAWWSKYERGEAKLSRADKNDLRRAVGLPELPLSIEEALTAIHPDAVIYRVGGSELADKVVVIAEPDPITIRLNGDLRIIPDHDEDSLVTAVTTPTAGAKVRMRDMSSIVIKKPVWRRLNDLRNRRGITWEQLLSNLLEGE